MKQSPMSAKRTKILVISGVFPPMAIAEADHIARLCEELAGHGYDIDVLTSTKGTSAVAKGYRVHPVIPDWGWASRSRIARFASKVKPDLVFIWYVGMAYDYHPMITFAASHLKAVLPNAKIVTQVTSLVGSEPTRFSKTTRMFRKAAAIVSGGASIDYHYGTLFRDSDRVIAMADSHLKHFAEVDAGILSKSSIVPPPSLIPMSPATDASRRRGRDLLRAGDADKLFVYFGRLYRGKGLEYLLTAFQRVHARRPQTRLAIIGGPTPTWLGDTWSVEQLHEQARAAGIHDVIAWSGEFPFDSDIGSIYLRAGDFAVLPFEWGSALNNSSIAACAAHGLPILTTRRDPEDPDLVDGQNVLLCESQNADALADSMERLLDDPELVERLRRGSVALAETHFNWPASVARTIAVFDAALNANVVQAAE
jgi:glycosyltransferase involved in cell wall biosynthesis